MASTTVLGEFRPVAPPARARVILGVVLTAVIVPLTLFGTALVLLPHRIAYEISDDGISVTLDRAIWTSRRTVRFDDLESAEAATLHGGHRVAGTSLPGYCVGHFRYPDLGDVWQATDCSPAVVVLRSRREPRPLVLSPRDPQMFLAAVREHRPERSELPEGPPATSLTIVRWLVLLPLPIVLMVPLLFFAAPKRLLYRITSDSLEVRLLLWTRRFHILGAKAAPHRPSFGLKLAGSSMPGYHVGLFMVDGTSTRVYATTTSEGILIEGEQRIFVTPEDPTAFLSALSMTGASVESPPW